MHQLANLFILSFLEVVLGFDNLVFISLISEKLPQAQRRLARKCGVFAAMLSRLVFLAGAQWMAGLQRMLFHWHSLHLSIRDVIFIAGGLFLIAKGTWELPLHSTKDKPIQGPSKALKLRQAIVQIMIFDIIFSIDSVITAIGISQDYWVMATAIVLAMCVMWLAAESLSAILNRYPAFSLLAMSFLILIGMVMIADGFGIEIPRGYVYFAIFFALCIEILHISRGGRD